jgi:hypothetical protein
MARPGRKKEKPKPKYDGPPVESVLRKAEILGCGVKNVEGTITLDLPAGTSQEMSCTTAGRLRARGLITKPEYEAALWFRDTHRSAFGVPTPHTSKYDGLRGNVGRSEPYLNPKAQKIMKDVEKDFKRKQEYYNFETLVSYISHDSDPVWLNGILTLAHHLEWVKIRQAIQGLMRK